MLRYFTIFITVLSFYANAGKSTNVEYINVAPSNYKSIDLIPGYGPISENGTQYIKLVVIKNDGFGLMDSVMFLQYDNRGLVSSNQNYHYCSKEYNKCFIEFNIRPSKLSNLVVELHYTKRGNKYSSDFREYRITGLGTMNDEYR